jgi:transforming growth factor-beta-induced protein
MLFLLYGCAPEASNNNMETDEASLDVSNQSQAAINDDLSTKNILQVAIGSPDHTTLVAGVQAAALEAVLANNGPLTVFAPNNAAFEKLPAGTLEELLKPENQKKLKRIITYHAAPGTYKGDLLKDGMTLFMATGDNTKIAVNGDEVTVNGAKILATIDASNGVVHVINRTLVPASSNVVEIAQSYNPDEFSQLVAALVRTSGQDPDLLAALSGDGAFTVFAPTDAAFEALYTALGVASVDEIPLATLTAVLQHHVIASPRVFSTDLESGTFLTLNGNITIDATAGTITDGSGAVANLADAALLNVLGTNGVIHVIDKVLLPTP